MQPANENSDEVFTIPHLQFATSWRQLSAEAQVAVKNVIQDILNGQGVELKNDRFYNFSDEDNRRLGQIWGFLGYSPSPLNNGYVLHSYSQPFLESLKDEFEKIYLKYGKTPKPPDTRIPRPNSAAHNQQNYYASPHTLTSGNSAKHQTASGVKIKPISGDEMKTPDSSSPPTDSRSASPSTTAAAPVSATAHLAKGSVPSGSNSTSKPSSRAPSQPNSARDSSEEKKEKEEKIREEISKEVFDAPDPPVMLRSWSEENPLVREEINRALTSSLKDCQKFIEQMHNEGYEKVAGLPSFDFAKIPHNFRLNSAMAIQANQPEGFTHVQSLRKPSSSPNQKNKQMKKQEEQKISTAAAAAEEAKRKQSLNGESKEESKERNSDIDEALLFGQWLQHQLVAKQRQRELEQALIINWHLPWSSRLSVLKLKSNDGNGLVHATTLALFGMHDRGYLLKETLNSVMNFFRNYLFPTFSESYARENGFDLKDKKREREVEKLYDDAAAETERRVSAPVFSPLHIWVLAHILRRPIIVYSKKRYYQRTSSGVVEARPNPFRGIYLPTELPPHRCRDFDCGRNLHPRPVVLVYHVNELPENEKDSGQFLAAVPTESEFPHPCVVPLDAPNTADVDDTQLDQSKPKPKALERLPIRFLPSKSLTEEAQSGLLHLYLNLAYSGDGVLQARLDFPTADAVKTQQLLSHSRTAMAGLLAAAMGARTPMEEEMQLQDRIWSKYMAKANEMFLKWRAENPNVRSLLPPPLPSAYLMQHNDTPQHATQQDNMKEISEQQHKQQEQQDQQLQQQDRKEQTQNHNLGRNETETHQDEKDADIEQNRLFDKYRERYDSKSREEMEREQRMSYQGRTNRRNPPGYNYAKPRSHYDWSLGMMNGSSSTYRISPQYSKVCGGRALSNELWLEHKEEITKLKRQQEKATEDFYAKIAEQKRNYEAQCRTAAGKGKDEDRKADYRRTTASQDSEGDRRAEMDHEYALRMHKEELDEKRGSGNGNGYGRGNGAPYDFRNRYGPLRYSFMETEDMTENADFMYSNLLSQYL